MKFEQLQAIEYSLEVIDEILEHERYTEHTLKKNLVLDLNGKLITANTYKLSERTENPSLLYFNSEYLVVEEKSYSLSSKNDSILFNKIRYFIWDEFKSLYDRSLVKNESFLLKYLEKATGEFDYSNFERFQTTLFNVKFLETGIELPFINLKENADSLEIFSLI